MALKGIKVLELAGLAPAPFCGMLLGDSGAEILRIDKLHSNPQLDCLGHGKKSVALNLKTPNGVAILKKLAKQSDIILEPFRSGVMESLGLGPDILLNDNPRLIYARLSGYGQSGPLRQKAGHDINYIALSGIHSLLGRHGEKPAIPVNVIGDFGGGGLMCAFGILLALFQRSVSGRGQIVDCSITEGSAYLGSWLYRSQNLPIWGNARGKNVLDGGAHFYEVYETKDGKYMSVGALESQFYAELVKGLQLEEVPQWGDFDASKEIFRKKFATKTQEEWCAVFENLDACVQPILTIDEAPRHAHNIACNSFAQGADQVTPSPAPKLNRTPGVSQIGKPVPQIGQHTMSTLKQLGYIEEDIYKLEKEGTIGLCRESKL